jgi:YNFM family putative membrane transporter
MMPPPANPEANRYLERGSPAFWQANLALFLSGFSTFALLYSVQPLLPILAQEFAVSPGESSLSLSLTTGSLAVAMLFASSVSDAWGRKRLMLVALLASALLNLLLVVVPMWHGILVVRTLVGISLGGLPAVAMAYLNEEIDPRASGFAMGLYIGGNAIGGMSGRLLVGVIADFTSWRVALSVLGVVALGSALVFWKYLPPSRHFVRRPLRLRGFIGSFTSHFRDAGLRWLFVESFLLMGSFVTIYNYIGFRLSAPPFELRQSTIASIFVVYLVGTGSSAWIGSLAGRLGRRKVLWSMILAMAAGLAMMVMDSLVLIIVGIATVTFGFFGGHSIASSWVGNRARHGRAQAASLYLFFYYTGSSIAGSAGGLFWSRMGWPGVTLLVAALLMVAFAIAIRLFFLPPLPLPENREPSANPE